MSILQRAEEGVCRVCPHTFQVIRFGSRPAADCSSFSGRRLATPIRNPSRSQMPGGMLWRVSRPIRTRCKPPGFILPCQPALAKGPPAGPGSPREIKFHGCRVIARKDGEQVRLWARTTSDYSKVFTRIRDAIAALPVESAVRTSFS